MRKSIYSASLLAVVVAVAPACATKKFVRTEVGNVNSKVDTLSTTLEQTQGRIQQDEAKIGQVDQKAEAAGQAAQAAQNAANAAGQAARQANTRADQVAAQTTAVEKDVAGVKKLIYEVTLSEAQGNFQLGKADLPDAVKTRIDQVISQLKTDPKNVYIEIEGHTDNVGDKAFNEKLGLARAEAVKRYLYQQHQVPLHKINTVSYGETRPVAPNTTKAGRAKNRRIVVRVVA